MNLVWHTYYHHWNRLLWDNIGHDRLIHPLERWDCRALAPHAFDFNSDLANMFIEENYSYVIENDGTAILKEERGKQLIYLLMHSNQLDSFTQMVQAFMSDDSIIFYKRFPLLDQLTQGTIYILNKKRESFLESRVFLNGGQRTNENISCLWVQ